MKQISKPEIIEQFSHGKISDNSYSEDRALISEHAYGVIDGSKGPGYLEPDMIQVILDQAQKTICSLDPQVTPRILVDDLTANVLDIKKQFGFSDIRYTGAFGFVVYIPAKHEIWRVADCPFRYHGKTYLNEIELEFIAARQRAVFIEAMSIRGMSQKEILASEEYANSFSTFFAPLLDFANQRDHKYGFGSINGLEVPEKFIQVFNLPDNLEELVLTSDGYPVVHDNLEASEAALAQIIARDPFCIDENCTSKGLMLGQCSFDDRTYLRLKLQ